MKIFDFYRKTECFLDTDLGRFRRTRTENKDGRQIILWQKAIGDNWTEPADFDTNQLTLEKLYNKKYENNPRHSHGKINRTNY